MRKNVYGRQFGRDSAERKALFKALASSLVLHERIETTEEKAKSVKGHIEKIVTKAIKADQNAERVVEPFLNAQAKVKMVTDIAPRFKNRPGGYTRIIRMGKRLQDNAMMVILEWVEKRPEPVTPQTAKTTMSTKEATTPTKTTKKAPAKEKTTKKEAKPTEKKAKEKKK